MTRLISIILILFTAHVLSAQVVSDSGQEVDFTYQTEFRSSGQRKINPQEQKLIAEKHAAHLFGLFQAREYAVPFGYNSYLIEGFAGYKALKVEKVEIANKSNDPYVWIRYRASGRALVLREVAKSWFKGKQKAEIEFPLIEDFSEIYNEEMTEFVDRKWKKCTDPHYNEASDFYYFHNPFICTELAQPPIGNTVKFKISAVSNQKIKSKPLRRDILFSDNKNGKLAVLYFVNGFDAGFSSDNSSAKIKRDYGWKLYQFTIKNLVKRYGFTEIQSEYEWNEILKSERTQMELLAPVAMEHFQQRRFYSTLIKKEQGITFIARVALFDTENATKIEPLASFPKFWKEAWENGDFIYYAGHSGDGLSLSLDVMLKNLSALELDKIQFPKNKYQLAFIDACSSYTHYLDAYKAKNKRLDVISYGLVSLFHLAEPTLETLLDVLLLEDQRITWSALLGRIEKNQLLPHLQFLWGEEYGELEYKKLSKKRQYPNSLLNVYLSEDAL